MTKDEENVKEKFKDNLVSYIKDHHPSCSIEDVTWYENFIDDLTSYYYNSGYKDAMELNEIDFATPTGDFNIGDEEDDSSVVFDLIPSSVSDDVLLQELKHRGYKGELTATKVYKL